MPPWLAGRSLPNLVVPPDLFAAQMGALADAGWHTITAGQLADDLAAGREPAPKTFVVTFDDGYADGYTYALPILRSHRFVATYFIIPGRIANGGSFLSPAEVQQLSADGNEIGNHSMSHVDFTRQTRAQLRFQVDGASTLIARATGRWPESLAYPFGAWNMAVARFVGACGPLRIAVTTALGVSETWATRFETPRLRVGPETAPAALVALLEPWQ